MVAINHVVRREDEWFDEPDELDRIARALAAIELIEDLSRLLPYWPSGWPVRRPSLKRKSELRCWSLAGFLTETDWKEANSGRLTIGRSVYCWSRRPAAWTSVLTLSRFYQLAGSHKAS